MNEQLINAACSTTGQVVAQVRPDQHALPTPCSEWNVRQLSNHLLSALELGRALLSGSMPAVQAGPGQVPAEDLVGDDLLASYQAATAAFSAAATPDALAAMSSTPMGEMPGAVLAGFATLDLVVHGWDLATAIGVPPAIPADLAMAMLEFTRQTMGDGPEMRGGLIGPVVTVPADADAVTQLIGYVGRNP